MRSFVSIVLCVSAGCIAWAQETAPSSAPTTAEPKSVAEARAIIEKAREALKQIKTIRYQMKFQAHGWMAKYAADTEGSVLLGELSELNIPRFRCEIRITPADSKSAIELQASSDGEIYYVIDPKTRIVHADIDEAVLGSQSQDVLRVPFREFVIKEPLANELRAKQIEWKGEVKVGDVACHQIEVTMTETRRSTWFIAKQDWLPRRLVRVVTDATLGEGYMEYELQNLQPETTFDPKQFKLTVPAGYRKTDDFAP